MHDLKVIFEDGHILVIDKPAGLVTTPSETQKELTLSDILQQEFNIQLERGGIVHRLDKETSGVLVVAKTLPALENLHSQFKSRAVQKEYITLVHGTVLEAGLVEGSIGRNPGDREKFTVLEDGKQALTQYEPVERLQLTGDKLQEIFSDFNKIQMRKLAKMNYHQFTLLKCRPKTGRTHQVRVHLKYIGHSVVGDSKYAGRKIYRLDHRWCPRQFLHAARLQFRHPVSGEAMSFESALPKDLKKALEYLNE